MSGVSDLSFGKTMNGLQNFSWSGTLTGDKIVTNEIDILQQGTCPTPTAGNQIANKDYVDNAIPVVTGFLKIDGSNSMTADLNVGSNQIKNVSNGTLASDAVNLSQLTAVITDVNTNTANISTNTAAISTANTNISNNAAAISTANTNISNNATAIAGCLKLDGSNAMTASLDAGTNKLVNVVDPTAAQDGATKAYVDSVASPWTVSTDGGAGDPQLQYNSGSIKVDNYSVMGSAQLSTYASFGHTTIFDNQSGNMGLQQNSAGSTFIRCGLTGGVHQYISFFGDNSKRIMTMNGEEGRISIGTEADSDPQNGGGGLEIFYKGTALPTDQEYIPLTLAYQQTNLHASTFPRYRFRLDSISASTGYGNGLFSIDNKSSTSSSYYQVLSLTPTGQLLINKRSPRDSPAKGNFCIQSVVATNTSYGYNEMGEFRNLTHSHAFQSYWTGFRFIQVTSGGQQSGGGRIDFKMGIEAVNSNNGKGELSINPYGGVCSIAYNYYIGTGYRFRVNGGAYSNVGWYGSDDRIKYNESSIESALPIINKLKPYKYEKITYHKNQRGKWIPSDEEWDEVKNDEDASGNRLYEYCEEIGFIAQDIRKEIPELAFSVSGEEEDSEGNQEVLGLNYNNIFCLAIQAIQELSQRVTALETEISQMKS